MSEPPRALSQEFLADVEIVGRIAAVPTILDVVCRTTGMRFAAVARVTEDRWVACSVLDEINFGLKPGGELKVETTICHEIRQSRQAVIIDNVAEDAEWCRHATPAPASPVVGVGTFIHVVANLDKTIRFYGDRLGLELNGPPGPRAFSTNAVVENLYNAKGSQSRVAVFKIPGSPLGVEFVEFQNASQQPFRPRLQDPGASLLTLVVRDVDSVMAKLREDATPMVGKGIIKDPDGFYVQLVQGTSGARLSLTVDRMDRTLHVFRDLLGFQPHGTTAKVPGTDFEVEFMQFKGTDSPPVSVGIHDTGAGVLRLVVRDVDGLLQNLKTAGVPVVTAGGVPVSFGDRHVVILRDPDNFFFQLFPQPVTARQ